MKKLSGPIQKIIKFSYYIFPFVWLVAFFISLGKTFFYMSFLESSRYINFSTVYFLTIILGVALLFYYKKNVNYLYNLFYKVSRILVVVVGVLLLAFSYLEQTRWPNYVLSKFHVRLPSLTWLFIFLCMFIFVKVTLETKKFKPLSKIIPFLVIWTLISNFFVIAMLFARDVRFMVYHPNASYEQKMKEKVGDFFYDYITFINDNTEPDSKILIPPSASYPWPQTGNAGYMRYFLYPRTLLGGEEYLPGFDLKKEDIDYVLIAWGETLTTSGNHTHGWPKFDVEAEKVIYMVNNKEKREEVGDYIYKDLENKELWGIIKVKK